MKFKLTPLEKKWILYDVGNSAFAMLTATILPIYFNYLAKQKSGTFFSRLLVVLGLCRFNLHAAHCNYGTDFGSHCRCQGSEEKTF